MKKAFRIEELEEALPDCKILRNCPVSCEWNGGHGACENWALVTLNVDYYREQGVFIIEKLTREGTNYYIPQCELIY